MELDDASPIGVSQVVGLEDHVVPLGDDGTAGAFQESIVVRREDVRPGESEQFRVEGRRFVLQVGDGARSIRSRAGRPNAASIWCASAGT